MTIRSEVARCNVTTVVVHTRTTTMSLPGEEVLKAKAVLVDRRAVERGYTLKLSPGLTKTDNTTTATVQ